MHRYQWLYWKFFACEKANIYVLPQDATHSPVLSTVKLTYASMVDQARKVLDAGEPTARHI